VQCAELSLFVVEIKYIIDLYHLALFLHYVTHE